MQTFHSGEIRLFTIQGISELYQSPALVHKSGTAGRFRYPFDAMKRKKRTPKRKTNAPKPRYRVRNWAQYDRALVQRAALTLWIADDLPNH